jgi:hypothetical protein
VDIPEPEAGLVIRYAYLWRDEQRRGLEEGQKDRPCAIVLAVARAEGSQRVVVAAITHSPPHAGTAAIRLPPQTAKRLGLDDEPQWIVTHEINVFTFPGPDIRPVPSSQPPSIAYGYLPHGLTAQLISQVRENVHQRTSVTIERDEP